MTYSPLEAFQRESLSNELPIAQKLKDKSQNYRKLLAEVLKWTRAQPVLTRKLCQLIADAQDAPPIGTEIDWFERLIQQQVVAKWETIPELEHMQTIRD